MPQRIVICLLLCLGLQTIKAQDQVDCTYLLEDAREAYEAGMVELVPELLLECINTNGLSGEAKKEAYKLILNSYIFDYLTDEADSLMDRFVLEFPEYRAINSDPQEFVFLLESHLKDLGIDPKSRPGESDIVVEDTPETERPRRVITRGAGEYGNSVGFIFGIPLSFPKTLEGYSVGDPASDESHFALLPGIQLGAKGNYILRRRLELSGGLLYSLSRFCYSASPLSYTSYRYVEAQHQLLFPISAVFKFNPEDMRMCYYVRGGIEPGFLLFASGKGNRTSDYSQDELLVERERITSARKRFNLNVLFGGGLRIPLNDAAFIYAETRLSSDILRSNRDEYYYPDKDLTWELFHANSAFRVRQVSFWAGICWDLTMD